MNVSERLINLAEGLDNWEPRPYRPEADYCRIEIYGRHEPFILTPDEFQANESKRELRHVEFHVCRAGVLLSRAFTAGLFDDLHFLELHSYWRSICKQDSDSPSTAWWAQFFYQSVLLFNELREAGILSGQAFTRPPWAPSLNDRQVADFQMTSATRLWWRQMIIEVATLLENMIAAQQHSRVAVTPDRLLLIFEKLASELLTSGSDDPARLLPEVLSDE